MRKNKILMACAIIMTLATSCESEADMGKGSMSLSSSPISPFVTVGHTSRAVETTTANLKEFYATAFQDGQANYMPGVKYALSGSAWGTDQGSFYWPVTGDLNFYCYAPATPGAAGTFTINKDKQVLENFVPEATAAAQKDFVYAKATGSYAANASSGVNINFSHALSEITVGAKNDNTAYTVKVSGVRIGNAKSKGTFTFPSVDGKTAASWTLSSVAGDKASYETALPSAVTLGNTVSTLGGASATYMLIPQQLAKASKAADGNYIALNVTITSQGGAQVYSGWAYVGIDTNWQMNKHYTYTLDFTSGAGEDANGNDILSGKEIKTSVTVTDWDNESVDVPEKSIYEGHFDANSIMVKAEKGYYYGIDITRANTFWSNSDVGDAANIIGEGTEWVADVVWQDIPARAINFCDAKGNTISGDTYTGKGKNPLYVKAAGSTPGNVVVGIKKKDSSDYLWSWHLWITEEPQEIAGFMDRNLGATSATPSDGAKTYGLYYQFGRKDPFVGNVNIYDINGTKLQTRATFRYEKVTFAKTVLTPGTFYANNNGDGEWASPNNYTSNRWNDITDASGKTFFDPCPPGWKLPDISAFNDIDNSTMIVVDNICGIMYNANWFPCASVLVGDKRIVYSVDRGFYWSDSPKDYLLGKDAFFYYYSGDLRTDLTIGDERAKGESVRCIQE